MKSFIHILTALMAASALAGCQKNDKEVTNQTPGDNAPRFYSQSSTKAVGNLWSEGDKVGIFMTKAGEGISDASIILGGKNVAHGVSQADRNCSFIAVDPNNKIFFPGNGDHVDFTAYCPYSEAVVSNIYPIILTDQSNTEAIDLITAKATDKNSTDPNVALEFRHRLAKLDISVRESNSLTDEIKGATIEIDGFASKGSFDLNTGLITPDNQSEKVISSTVNQFGYATFIVMPFEKGQVTNAKVTITTKSGIVKQYNIPYSSLTEGIQYPLLYDLQSFPDEAFRAYLVSAFGVTEKNGDIDPTDPSNKAKIEAVTDLRCGGKAIKNLQGIEYFTNLTSLICNDNLIETLDLSTMPKLTSLNCNKNKLALIDISGHLGLTSLDCGKNMIKILDVSNHNALTDLRCSTNSLTELILPTNGVLTKLYCSENQIYELLIPEGLPLTYLACDNNNLSKLDVSKIISIATLSCGRNPITELNLSSNTNLLDLRCYLCRLTSLDLSTNNKLVTIHSYENQMTELDITALPNVVNVWCGNQKIKGLVLKLTQAQFDDMWQKTSNKDYYDNLDVETEIM